MERLDRIKKPASRLGEILVELLIDTVFDLYLHQDQEAERMMEILFLVQDLKGDTSSEVAQGLRNFEPESRILLLTVIEPVLAQARAEKDLLYVGPLEATVEALKN
ncbi:MAG: hypothetical protein ACYCQJ_15930 [Nitrososphaerales archaeon]